MKRPLLIPLALWLVPVLSLSLTAYAWRAATVSIATHAEERFRFRADVINASVRDRMKSYEDIVRGVAGLFDSSNGVTRPEWGRYVGAIRPDVFAGGLQALGVSVRVPAADRTRVEEAVHDERLPFAIWPPGSRDEYHPIIYIHPFEGANLQALGYDIGVEAMRREAMARAIDTGRPALSRRLRLAQEDALASPQPGFVLYYPFYRPGLPTGTPAERRAALSGTVFAAFRAHDLIDSVFAASQSDVDFEIHDGERRGDDTLLYRSAHLRETGVASTAGTLTHRAVMRVGGQPWLLLVEPSPAFLSETDRSQPWLIAVGGILVSLMFAIGLWSSLTVRRRSLVMAERMSAAFRANDVQTRLMVDSIDDHAIFRLDDRRNVASWNAGAARMLGYADAEILGQPVSSFLPDTERDEDTAQIEASFNGRHAREGWHLRKGGERFWGALAIAPMQHETSGRPGYVVILRDDTERRQAMEALAVTSAALEQRTVELGRFNRLATGRELRMIELKQMVNERSLQLGMPPPFDLKFAEGFEDVSLSGSKPS